MFCFIRERKVFYNTPCECYDDYFYIAINTKHISSEDLPYALKDAAKPAWNLLPTTLSVEFAKSTRPKFSSMFPTGNGHTIPAPQLALKESLKLDALNVCLTFWSCGMRHPAFTKTCP